VVKSVFENKFAIGITYLGPDAGVLHMLLECSWVALSLLEDTLQDWVLHDAQDL
jgi:hypothetical protein